MDSLSHKTPLHTAKKVSAVYSHNAVPFPRRDLNASREAFSSSPESIISAWEGGTLFLSEELPFTNINTCFLCKPLSIHYLHTVIWNSTGVSQHLQRWRSNPFIIFSFVFLCGHSELPLLPGITRNVLSAPIHRGACHSVESCHKDMLKPKHKNGPGWWFIHTKERCWHENVWTLFLVFFLFRLFSSVTKSLSLFLSLLSVSLSPVHLYSCHQVGKRRKYNQGGLWRHVWGHGGPLILYRTCLLWGHQPSRQHQRQPQRWRLLWVDHQILAPFQKCDIAPGWAAEPRRVSSVCRPQSAPAWLLNLSPCRWTLALTLSSTAPGQEIPLWPSCGWRGGLEWWELHSISLSSTSHVVASGFEKVYLWEFVKIKERKRLMSWRDDSPTWTSSDPEFTSIPAFLCQHQRPNSSTFPSLSGNLNWILIIE